MVVVDVFEVVVKFDGVFGYYVVRCEIGVVFELGGFVLVDELYVGVDCGYVWIVWV